jgi:hypothetical protein
LTELDKKPRVPVAFPGATAISADANSERLVVAYPTSVRVFDAHTLKPVTEPIALPTAYTTFYPSGGGEIWNLAPSNLRSAACGLAGRNLTEQEWQKCRSWAGPRRATCPQFPRS